MKDEGYGLSGDGSDGEQEDEPPGEEGGFRRDVQEVNGGDDAAQTVHQVDGQQAEGTGQGEQDYRRGELLRQAGGQDSLK